jgi:Iron-containing redox enzyme
MRMPPSRGPLSAWLSAALLTEPAGAPRIAPPPLPAVVTGPCWHDEDLQLALWCCYELHYRGFDDVPEEWEWQPLVLGFRGELEQRWVMALRGLARPRAASAAGIPADLSEMVHGMGGPDLSGYLARKASEWQFAEVLVHKSVYQLKEADPHSFGIPRLSGPVKAALVEIQSDEYGGGRPERMHAELFRSSMRWLGLDDSYGHYVPAVPAVTLAVSNLMSLFALHRRWLGALLGHLAALEMTSTGPNRRYAAGARRLGAGPDGCRYFLEHVEADAVHEQIAAYDLCGGYAKACPDRSDDILFGAACCLALDEQLASYLLGCWQAERTSLRGADQPPRAA